MAKSSHRQKIVLFIGDILLILAATRLSAMIRFDHRFDIFDIHTGASCVTLLMYLVFVYIFDLYNIALIGRSDRTLFRTAVAILIAGVLSTSIFYSLPARQFGRGIFLLQMLLVWALLSGWRLFFAYVRRFPAARGNALILGAGSSGECLCRVLDTPFSPYRVVGFLDDDERTHGKSVSGAQVLGHTLRLNEIALRDGVNTAIYAMENASPGLLKCLMAHRFNGIQVMDMREVYERLTGRVPVHHIRDEWFIFTPGFNLLYGDFLQNIKRLIDLAVSSALILATLPVLLATAAAVKLDSPGPVFFRQQRVGKDRTVFTLWKFRSMTRDAERSGPVWARKDDPRTTRVGRWIRKFRIDELPQLINVFRGEMSLVGPRPERPEFVRDLTAEAPYYSIRHSVRPGITGWAQVNFPYGASVEDACCKLEYDLYYIKNMSLSLDFRILMKTVGVVIFGDGAR